MQFSSSPPTDPTQTLQLQITNKFTQWVFSTLGWYRLYASQKQKKSLFKPTPSLHVMVSMLWTTGLCLLDRTFRNATRLQRVGRLEEEELW